MSKNEREENGERILEAIENVLSNENKALTPEEIGKTAAKATMFAIKEIMDRKEK